MTLPKTGVRQKKSVTSSDDLIPRLLKKYAGHSLQSRSRKSVLKQLTTLKKRPDLGRFRGASMPVLSTSGARIGNSAIPLTIKQFLQPELELYSTELKNFDSVSLLVSLPKVNNLTFLQDICETVNTIWVFRDMKANFPNEEFMHTHEPLSRTIVIQSLNDHGEPKSSIEFIANVVYETAMIDLFHSYPNHYHGVVGERLAYIQVQIFLNVAASFFKNLNRFQPFSRIISPTQTIQLISDHHAITSDEFVRLENENAVALATCNHIMGLKPDDYNLYL